ncbi:MAG: response regulator [Bdellovibrionales bacterium]|nr:response regulator [Bdellovibrionales bacterium]
MSIKLVIADDAPFVVEVVRQIALEAGFDVVGQAFDGEEAVKIAHHQQPDVVLLDMVMPKKNGLVVAEEILSKFPKTKIIACSTVNDEDLIMKAIGAGCCDFISKPFSKDEIIRVIEKSVKEN